ncbi:TetR/AcrR family transcriptional regulator [Streptoalloteichus hindustanus]|uniref:Transcriptional regulator, TetR family n=1 Tax=Streptoalloteichus hindustanus TaxID=2017 RepID=A0A1M4ZIY7_STRHI|nr:TetR/AcrR family transcriptional regulator [Streptoalloteichus hindustanus]SHF17526.1 transcriptional regulator, TetR family [Streptoalloteichus hindustanus]
MGEAGAAARRGQVGARGRIDKRQAILDAALTVFAREGYAQAGMDVVAAEAGVAKATVYNHFHDKENLLRQTIAALSDQVLAENLGVVGRLADQGEDLRDLLEDVGLRLLRCYCADQSWALRRLLSAEIVQFPDLLDIVHGRAADPVTEALADRLARLTVAGRLSTRDPLMAAEQFCSLLTGPMDKRARLGTRQVPDDELRAVARAAVDTFLQAFAAKPARNG